MTPRFRKRKLEKSRTLKKGKKKKKKSRRDIKHIRKNQATICQQLQDLEGKMESVCVSLVKVNLSDELTKITDSVHQLLQLHHQQQKPVEFKDG